MITRYNITAQVYCHRFKSKYLHSMRVVVNEEDGMLQYPPQIEGCNRSSIISPCPACIAYVKNNVYRAMPLPNRGSIEVNPPQTICEEAAP